MKIENHLLLEADFVVSPNCDDRPDETDISLIVIHCISLPPDIFGGDYISQLFCNSLDRNAHSYFQKIADLRVSAHLLVRRNGAIVQYVPFNRRAWHAGISEFRGRNRCNDFSIGIELEGSISTAYADCQYKRLAEIVTSLMRTYPRLNKTDIAGHSDIAPNRKNDPGPFFDWQRFLALLGV